MVSAMLLSSDGEVLAQTETGAYRPNGRAWECSVDFVKGVEGGGALALASESSNRAEKVG